MKKRVIIGILPEDPWGGAEREGREDGGKPSIFKKPDKREKQRMTAKEDSKPIRCAGTGEEVKIPQPVGQEQ